jgi:hypothetical protein
MDGWTLPEQHQHTHEESDAEYSADDEPEDSALRQIGPVARPEHTTAN